METSEKKCMSKVNVGRTEKWFAADHTVNTPGLTEP